MRVTNPRTLGVFVTGEMEIAMSATITIDHRQHLFHQARLFAVGALLAVTATGTAIVVAQSVDDSATTKHPPAATASAGAAHSDPLVTRFGSQPATDTPTDPFVTRFGTQQQSYDGLRMYDGRR
jgi:hypothetical protein